MIVDCGLHWGPYCGSCTDTPQNTALQRFDRGMASTSMGFSCRAAVGPWPQVCQTVKGLGSLNPKPV